MTDKEKFLINTLKRIFNEAPECKNNNICPINGCDVLYMDRGCFRCPVYVAYDSILFANTMKEREK